MIELAVAKMLWWLLVAHALCDFPLQGDFLARAKNHRYGLPGIPWFPCMLAHALIHGGAVAIVTGHCGIGFFEAFFHFMIDSAKCDGAMGFLSDQVCHLATKVLWVVILFWFPWVLT